VEELSLCFQCWRPDRTRECARALSGAIGADGLVVSLTGSLGAGKTVFVKGLAEGLGVAPEAVSSPTFAIAHEYTGPAGRRLAHVDLHRIQSVAELEDTGFLDLLEPGAVVAVEWGDRFPEALPRDRLDLRLTRPASNPPRREAVAGVADAAVDSELRRIEARAGGKQSEGVLIRWRQALLSSGSVEFEQGRWAAWR
jgi:tRNA threonylcarbamoyladenosine biosynthesis protein TsaE